VESGGLTSFWQSGEQKKRSMLTLTQPEQRLTVSFPHTRHSPGVCEAILQSSHGGAAVVDSGFFEN
jgi:hypothetical protein